VSSTAIQESRVGAGEGAPTGLKTLVFLSNTDYFRLLEGFLWTMLAAGHQVLVALEHNGGGAGGTQPLDALREKYPGFDYRQLAPRKDLWLIPASAIRRRLDYLRHLDSEHAELAPDRAPQPTWGTRVLLFLPPFRWAWGRRLLVRFLTRLEAAMPIPGSVRSFIKEQAPRVVVVSPLAESGSAQGDYIRAAEAAGIPSVVVMGGEDDLTSKGGIRDVPTLMLVHDDGQADQAVRLHGLPQERLVVVGAESSDGRDAPEASNSVEAVERAATTEVVRRPEGRILRPVLWLLTPLLAILLPLVRPVATARAVSKAVRRLPARMRKAAKTRRRKRAEKRKAAAAAAKEQKAAQAAAKREQKAARARAKGQARRRTNGAGQQTKGPEVAGEAGDERSNGATETETERTRG
jgi:hypothetical protein